MPQDLLKLKGLFDLIIGRFCHNRTSVIFSGKAEKMCLAYLTVFSVQANSDVTEYLVSEELMGLYQSSQTLHLKGEHLGFIDRVVQAIIADTDVELSPRVMPAFRARSYRRSNPEKEWISYSFIGGVKSAEIAGARSEAWIVPGEFDSFHLGGITTKFWCVDDPGFDSKCQRNLQGKSVVILKNVGYDVLVELRHEFKLDIVRVNSLSNAVKMLAGGRVGYVYTSEASVHWYYERMGFDPRVLSSVDLPRTYMKSELYLLWGGRTEERLGERFRSVLSAMEASGELDRIRLRYRFDSPRS
jgi:hypothetical protein